MASPPNHQQLLDTEHAAWLAWKEQVRLYNQILASISPEYHNTRYSHPGQPHYSPRNPHHSPLIAQRNVVALHRARWHVAKTKLAAYNLIPIHQLHPAVSRQRRAKVLAKQRDQLREVAELLFDAPIHPIKRHTKD